jgi:hypothetical protein
MSSTTTFVASDAAAYERFMGRWSQRVAPLFVEFVGARAGTESWMSDAAQGASPSPWRTRA